MTGTKRALLAFVLLAAMTSAGCQTPPTATRQESERAKFLTPSPGIALVYVIRVERDKRDRVFDVSVDGEPLGKTRQGNFLMAELTPGMHRITSSWKNLTRYNLDMEFKADKTYYLEQRITDKNKFIYETKLEALDDVKGRNRLNRCTLSLLR